MKKRKAVKKSFQRYAALVLEEELRALDENYFKLALDILCLKDLKRKPTAREMKWYSAEISKWYWKIAGRLSDLEQNL